MKNIFGKLSSPGKTIIMEEDLFLIYYFFMAKIAFHTTNIQINIVHRESSTLLHKICCEVERKCLYFCLRSVKMVQIVLLTTCTNELATRACSVSATFEGKKKKCNSH